MRTKDVWEGLNHSWKTPLNGNKIFENVDSFD
jgi:hypothetical protein